MSVSAHYRCSRLLVFVCLLQILCMSFPQAAYAWAKRPPAASKRPAPITNDSTPSALDVTPLPDAVDDVVPGMMFSPRTPYTASPAVTASENIPPSNNATATEPPAPPSSSAEPPATTAFPALTEAPTQSTADKASDASPSETEETTTLPSGLSGRVLLAHQGLYQELRDDETRTLADMGMLWQAAVERSATIRYAIEKLSRKDATGNTHKDDRTGQRVLKSVARLGGVAGSMWTGTPAGMIGGSFMEELISDGQQGATVRLTDTDMLILAKAVETLQHDLLQAYGQYKNAKQLWESVHEQQRQLDNLAKQAELVSATRKTTRQTTLTSSDVALVLNALEDGWAADNLAAQQTLQQATNALALLVGPDALTALNTPQESVDKTDAAETSSANEAEMP